MEIIKNKLNYFWLAFAIIVFINLIMLCIPFEYGSIALTVITFVCLLLITGIFIALFIFTRKTTPLAFFYIIHAAYLLTLALLIMFGREVYDYGATLFLATLIAGIVAGIINIVWAILARKKVKNWIPNLIIGIALFLSVPFAVITTLILEEAVDTLAKLSVIILAAFTAWGVVMFVRGLLAGKSEAKDIVGAEEIADTKSPSATTETTTKK